MGKLRKDEIFKGIEYDTAKKVGNNTWEYMVDDVRIIRHMRTDILKFYPDGTIEFNSGGWRTLTTKQRINKFQDAVTIYQENRVWYVVECVKRTTVTSALDGSNMEFTYPDWKAQRQAKKDEQRIVFEDGMTWNPEVGIVGAGKEPDKKLVKKIRKYVRKFVEALPVKPPGAGDCFFCQMQTKDGKSLGDAQRDKDHLLSHIEENYFVPSLLYRAMKEAGCGDLWIASAFCEIDTGLFLDSSHDQFRKWLFNYLYRRIIDGNFEPTDPK